LQQQAPLLNAPLLNGAQLKDAQQLKAAAAASAAAVGEKHETQETLAAPLAAAPQAKFVVGGWGAGVFGNSTGTQFICFTTQFTCFTTQFTCFARRWKGARPPVSASSFLKLSLSPPPRKHPPCLVLAYCPV
jgi:hypothetical protein